MGKIQVQKMGNFHLQLTLSKVEALLDDPRFLSWVHVLQAMLKHRIRLEQETVFEYADFAGTVE
jgi:DNA topoisomerase VI subunit A